LHDAKPAVVLQVSAVSGLHAKHAAPLMPQAASVGGEVQVEPEQHPVAQLLGLQALVHTPAVQPPPPHCTHPLPPEPQYMVDVPARQVVPSQQPFGQLTPSHTQAPATQCCIAPQGPPVVPHTQVPPAVQVSALTPQAAHAMPGAPQADADGVTQAPLEQQPAGHEVESQVHAPPLQC
jgi:hypothetical protein